MSYAPIETMKLILNDFYKTLSNYHYIEFRINEYDSVLVIEDSLVLLIEMFTSNLTPGNPNTASHERSNPYLASVKTYGDTFAYVTIHELTYNQINYKFNNTQFIRGIMQKYGVYLPRDFSGSSSFTYYNFFKYEYEWDSTKSRTDYVAENVPQIDIHSRLDNWQGIEYYFVVFEMKASNEIYYAVAYTTQNPVSYVIQQCNNVLNGSHFSSEMRGSYKFNSSINHRLGPKKKQIILESGLSFFYITKTFKDKDLVWRYADEILNELSTTNKYDKFERTPYCKPVYRWTSEEQVLHLCHKIYGKSNVIYQHRPFFLKSPFGGQMSYDVFIVDKQIAIEYQGRQHFEPIDYFGGQEAFEKVQIRDKTKRELSIQHGIRLIYINYNDVISPTLIKEKVSSIER